MRWHISSEPKVLVHFYFGSGGAMMVRFTCGRRPMWQEGVLEIGCPMGYRITSHPPLSSCAGKFIVFPTLGALWPFAPREVFPCRLLHTAYYYCYVVRSVRCCFQP